MESTSEIKCIGFIMDGNRRYANNRNQETLLGHLAGKNKLFEVIEWVQEQKIEHVVFYAFSTENWKREKQEVDNLMLLFKDTISGLIERDNKDKLAVRVIGQREDFSAELQALINKLESQNPTKPTMTVWIALSYGGRAEIVAAANKAVALGKAIDADSFSKLLWSSDMPDPDLVIRTGGESRMSNFLTWQTVYSELFFLDTHWPAFTKTEFESILSSYTNRERRIGK